MRRREKKHLNFGFLQIRKILKFVVDKRCRFLYNCHRAMKKRERGVAQFGSVRALGAWGRGFKSLHPDHGTAPWSSGLRHRPFTAVTGVRVS